MRRRCQPGGQYYDKGIRVCKRWSIFKNFLKDVGLPPSPQHTLDRINPRKNYTKSNVRWADPRTQAENQTKTPARYITYKNQTLSIRQHCLRNNVSYTMVRKRLQRGWDFVRAIETPNKHLQHAA
jgi:hypothetical protein